jgi:hypothetical protein
MPEMVDPIPSVGKLKLSRDPRTPTRMTFETFP